MTSQTRRAGAALWLPRIGDLRPYLLLALLTLLLLTAAYAVRPVVRVDMGGDYDALFLSGFNGREIVPAGAGELVRWNPAADLAVAPGGRTGVYVAVLKAAPGLLPDALAQAAVAVNGVRVDMPRRTANSIVASVPAEVSDDPELVFTLVSPLVGDPPPPPGLIGEVELAPARTYRWSTGESSIGLPNLGRGTWTAQLDLIAAHPDGSHLNARIMANGHTLAELPETAAPRRVYLLIPPAALRDGNLTIEIVANTFVDPRPLGLQLASVLVAPAAGAGLVTAVPPLGSLGQALVVVLGAYASLAVLVGGRRQRNSGLPGYVWAALAVAVAAALGGWAIAAYRFPSSFMLPRLAWFAIWSLLLALALRPLTSWLFRSAGVPAEQTLAGRFLPALLVIFMIGYWLKALGMLYPYFVAIDVQWHMIRAQWILHGDLPLLYGTRSPLNDTTMPVAEWGAHPPVIPYSPWYHIFATLFAFTPMPMVLAANMWSLLIDSTRVMLIALIARKAGLNGRATLLAAATFAALPVSFLLHSWGNVPTTFGLWLTLVANTIIFGWWHRLHERVVMVTLSVTLLCAFLIYTVTGVFMGVFLVVLTALIWLNALRGGAWAELRRPLKALWTAAGVAIGLALLIYYGQYIPPIIATTVPYMSTVFTQGPQSVGVARPPFSQYIWGFVPHLDYRIWPGDYLYFGIAIPLLFTLPGFVALRRRPLAWVIFAAWFSVALLFMLAGYRISMVDKQIFYMLPVMCICWSIFADRYWRRGFIGRILVITIFLFTLATALDQWLLRIVTSPIG